LEELERRGLVNRVHGGAVSAEGRFEEPLFDDKTGQAAVEKRAIAAAALAEIKSGDTIYLDGGSTVLELARQLRARTDVTVVTNSLRAAAELSGQGPRLIVAGGEFRRLSQTLIGPLTRLLLEQVNVDKAFMGTIGLSVADGLTTTDPGEAFTKELVTQRAATVFLLADHSKFGRRAMVRAGRLDEINVLITDRLMDVALGRELKKAGVRVVETALEN